MLAALLLWELGARDAARRCIGVWPPPTEVAADLVELAGSAGYWNSWLLSFERVFWGFAIALLLGDPVRPR